MAGADAAGGQNFNAIRRDRMSKGWPEDVGGAKDDPSAAQGVNQWPGANRTTVKKASALEYQTYAQAGGTQRAVHHKGVPIGYVQKYDDPGHGALWSATIADHVSRRAPHVRQTQRGFVHASDAESHITDAHRDVAQIESSGVWRPTLGAGPNLPGH